MLLTLNDPTFINHTSRCLEVNSKVFLGPKFGPKSCIKCGQIGFDLYRLGKIE